MLCYYYYIWIVGLFILIYTLHIHLSSIKETFNILMLSQLSPISNSELDYKPSQWNRSDIREYNNCYAYATNDLNTQRHRKPHPGHKNNIETNSADFTCSNLTNNILKDFPNAYKTNFENPCKCNYYKAYLTVDPKNDFHLYRQDSNGYWSHKPGSLDVSNVDASKQIITNPETADRVYSKFNYSDSCMFFCVPSAIDCNHKK
jgi:hypothetical protein